MTTLGSKPFVEGSCVTDPCWYAVPGATGKEVIILDLYPGTGDRAVHQNQLYRQSDVESAANIVAKDIFARTETGAPVAVMCNSSAVCAIPQLHKNAKS